MDGMARPWQLALNCAMSVVHPCAGADGAASCCYNGLAWRQCVHGVVLQLLEVARWTEHQSRGEPRGTTGSASAPCLRGYAHAGAVLDNGLQGMHSAADAWPAEQPA
jgi:hypothetical protein